MHYCCLCSCLSFPFPSKPHIGYLCLLREDGVDLFALPFSYSHLFSLDGFVFEP